MFSGNALDAELGAAATQLAAMKHQARTDFGAKVSEIRGNVAAKKSKIDSKRGEASASVQAFETEFNEGWDQIKSAFRNLK